MRNRLLNFSFQFSLGPWMWGALIVIIALGFLFWQARPFVLAPWILGLNLPEQSTVHQNPFMVKGEVIGAKSLEINGKEIDIAAGGRFSEPLQLFYGLNIIELAAKNYLGRETIIRRYILYQ